MSRATDRADKALRDEMVRQVYIVYSAAAIAMWENYGWRQKRILGVLAETRDLWNACAQQPLVSMLRMLEEETGIEIQARGAEKSWHDLEYLNGEKEAYPMPEAQYIYMRTRQLPWVNPQITAAMLLALHRRYGWSCERDLLLLSRKDDVEARYKWKTGALVKACREITGINMIEEANVE